MRASIRDTEIFFDVDGASLIPDGPRAVERPTAFILPGGPGIDHLGLKARDAKLAEFMQLVYLDYRGSGRSARGNPEKYTLDEYVEDLEGLRQYLGLKKVACIGTSFGGWVAMAYAARYPQSVSHLILVVTASHPGYATRARQIVAAKGTPDQLEQCDALFAGHVDTAAKMHHYLKIMGPLYACKYDAKAFLEGLESAILEPEPLNRANGPEGCLRKLDLRPELAKIIAPTLIIGGRHDWICAPELSEEIHRLIPSSEIRIFERSAHSVGSDEPENYLTTIADFVRRNLTNASSRGGSSSYAHR